MNNMDKMMQLLEDTGMPIAQQEREQVWRFLRVLLANSFDHKDGTMVYLWLSRANHSCSPNAIRMIAAGKVMALIALKPIKAGEEVCITYVVEQTLLSPCGQRRHRLHSMFGFACMCARCESGEDAVRAFPCRRRGCPGTRCLCQNQLGACSVCGSCGSGQQELLAEVQILTRFNHFEERQRLPSVDACESLLVSALAVLSEHHWVVERLHLAAYEAHLRAGSYLAARDHQAARLRFLDAHLQQRPSLRRAVERSKLAQAHAMLGRFREALDVGREAMRELRMVVPGDRESCRVAAPRVREENPCSLIRGRLQAYLRGATSLV